MVLWRKLRRTIIYANSVNDVGAGIPVAVVLKGTAALHPFRLALAVILAGQDITGAVAVARVMRSKDP